MMIEKIILTLKQILFRFRKIFFSNEFSAEKSLRSDSDNGLYLSTIKKFLKSYRKFKNFRKNFAYSEILEHVNKQQGVAYLDVLKQRNDFIYENIHLAKRNDAVGNPKKFEFSCGKFSPTTLRYAKVASDLNLYFGKDIGKNVIEIGVGYGGQALLCDAFFNIQRYNLVDLSDVLSLSSKFLEHHLLNFCYETRTLNQICETENFDLVISNYAFSELPSNLQLQYIKKILSKSDRGYLTMNSGRDNSERSQNKLAIKDLENLLPKFEIFEEQPSTGLGNYLIIWGHKRNE